MHKKLFLHIGSPKTGTTSIQGALASNRHELERQGFVYPGDDACHHKFYFTTNQEDNCWPRQFRGVDFDALQSEITRYLLSLSKDFHRSFGRYIISTEYLFLDDEKAIQNTLSFLSDFVDEIEVVVFVRCPVSFYKSSQQQAIKASSRIASPWEYRYNFRGVIESWSRYVKTHVVGYNPEEGDSLSMLCDLIGIDEERVYKSGVGQNVSITIEQMLLLEKIQGHIYPDKDDIMKRHLYLIHQIKMNGLNRPVLSLDAKRVVYARHLDDLEWLKGKYGIDFLDKNLSNLSNVEEVVDKFPGRPSVRDIYLVENANFEAYEAAVIDYLLRQVVAKAKA